MKRMPPTSRVRPHVAFDRDQPNARWSSAAGRGYFLSTFDVVGTSYKSTCAVLPQRIASRAHKLPAWVDRCGRIDHHFYFPSSEGIFPNGAMPNPACGPQMLLHSCKSALVVIPADRHKVARTASVTKTPTPQLERESVLNVDQSASSMLGKALFILGSPSLLGRNE